MCCIYVISPLLSSLSLHSTICNFTARCGRDRSNRCILTQNVLQHKHVYLVHVFLVEAAIYHLFFPRSFKDQKQILMRWSYSVWPTWWSTLHKLDLLVSKCQIFVRIPFWIMGKQFDIISLSRNNIPFKGNDIYNGFVLQLTQISK